MQGTKLSRPPKPLAATKGITKMPKQTSGNWRFHLSIARGHPCARPRTAEMTSHKSISETWRERDRARQRGQQRHQPSLQQRQQPRSYPCVEYTTLRTPRSKLRNVTNTQTCKRTTYSNLRFSRRNVENEMFEWLCTPAMIRTGRS
jgi:hypothetical protein